MKRVNKNGGFTLIELLITLSIIAIIVTMALFIDINSYRGGAFRLEQNSLGISLEQARADALNNINQRKHGVAIHPGGYSGYVIFEGNTYATRDVSRDEEIESFYDVTFSTTTPSEIVFEQLSGNADYDGDLVLIDLIRGMSIVITINHEGRISW